MMFLCRERSIALQTGKPVVMGILNATPDSFSDGGVGVDSKIQSLLSVPPEMVDIGGESTRPGALCVPAEEEAARVLPVIQKIRAAAPGILISVDTRKSLVARLALEAGADIINDVSCLRFDPEIANVVAEFSAGLILNHSRGTPENMNSPEFLSYPDGLAESVRDELNSAAEYALGCGVRKESVMLDPGFGFSKNTEQNLQLLRNPDVLLELGYPLLSGPSRKRFVGDLTGELDPEKRDFGTCGAVIASFLSGYSVVRVHNVKAAKDCLSVFYGCQKR
jgi:dihydropteroate synthase